MNWLILIFVLAVATFVTAEQYTDRYDDINVDEIIQNDKLFMNYINCVLDKGRCTKEGKELKAHVQDAMQTGCTKCTEKQRQKARQVVKHIKEAKQEEWEQMKAKYDPGDKFKDVYEPFLASDD